MAKKKTEETMQATQTMEKAVFTLPNKKVRIAFYPKATAMVTDPSHILYGGLGPRAGKTFQLPRTRTGQYFNPFPSDEVRLAMEKQLGMEEGGLSPARMENNFFDNYTISLGKADIELNLSDAKEALDYYVAKAQKDFVAPDRESIRHRATYMWYVEDEEVQAERKVLTLSKKAEAWKEFGKIEGSPGKLKQILIERRGKSTLPNAASKHEWLIGAVGELVEEDPTVFLNLVKDPNLAHKVTIYEAVTAGVISVKGTFYYNEEGTPLSMPGMQNDIGGVIHFITQPENSDYYATVKQRVQNAS
jgi:hypothetical protein